MGAGSGPPNTQSILKGDIIMENITFELNGITYTADATRKYCYATENGKKTRIGKVEFGKAEAEYELAKDIAETEESTLTEEIEEIAKELAPKTKKARKSKNVFHTSVAVPGLTLTAKQVSFILHLSDTCFWENGLDSCIWVDCLCDDITGEFAGKPMTVGAMISTLCEKGLGTRGANRRDGRKCTSFSLTELGKLVAAEVGLC